MKKPAVFVLFLAIISLSLTARSAEKKEPAPEFELYLVTAWSGKPLASKIVAWQKIPLKSLTVTLNSPGQIVYGYLLVKCRSRKQWDEWHKKNTPDKSWRIDHRRERPRGAGRFITADLVNLEPFFFGTDDTDPAVRSKTAYMEARRKSMAVGGFVLGPVREPPSKVKRLKFYWIFRLGEEKKTVAEIKVRFINRQGQ
ncbi:MAG: hypothetical protein SV487_06670 [Thermodesulfobacteriota bacterium]|nr:hypothetical protein [Thermodesulfobacteriota bacterium]